MGRPSALAFPGTQNTITVACQCLLVCLFDGHFWIPWPASEPPSKLMPQSILSGGWHLGLTCHVMNIIIIIIYRDCFPPSRWGSHVQGILTIFTEVTIKMMNLVSPVMASQKAGSSMTLYCTENLQSSVSCWKRTRAVYTAVCPANHLGITAA